MTEHDLATLVREHVTRDEPPFAMSADSAIALGRRTLVRRRARRGLAGLVVGVAAAVAVPIVLDSTSAPAGDSGRIDPASVNALADYDAAAMPKILSDAIGPVVRKWAPDLNGGDFVARDGQGQSIPKAYLDKASQMHMMYGLGEHTFEAILLHARSETEGDARQVCADDIASGYKFSCQVDAAPNGDLVITSVIAVRRADFVAEGQGEAWGVVTREELRTGKVLPGDASQRPIVPSEIYFERTVESVHSETFLTSAIERVQAPNLAQAKAAWEIPVSALVSLVTDPSLVIPKPPLGEGGCPWTWKMKVSCTRTDDSTVMQ